MTWAFPISERSPITYPGPPPASSDVVVIGGGVIGVSTALFLARQGVQVTLVEKGRIAGEQSSRNWGWIREQGRDPAELPIMVEANRLWRELASQTNRDIGLERCGVTYLARTEEELEAYANWLPSAKTHGVDTEVLEHSDLRRQFPEFADGGFVGALTTPSDMRAEPWVAVPALAEIAERAGARIVENCAARCLDLTAGRVAGVITEAGRITCSDVVVAGGAWSSLFLRAQGVNIPQLSVRASVAATGQLRLPHRGAADAGAFAFRSRSDGGVTLAAGGAHDFYIGPDSFRHITKYAPYLRQKLTGTRFLPKAPKGYPDAWLTPRHWQADQASPFEARRVLNPTPNFARLKNAAHQLERLFPDVGEIGIKSAWAGMIDVMPDVVPIVDKIAKIPGLTVATGMSGHGFGIGPGFGRILADLVTGNAIGHDLNRFRFGRFTDGSAINLGPSL